MIKDLPTELEIFSLVYVRKCYPEMLILICQRIDRILEMKEHHVAIRVTGTPGMGKSFFLGYVWYHLLKVKCDVVARVGSKIIRSRKGSDDRAYDVVTMEDYDRLCAYDEDVIFLADPDQRVPRTKGITIFFVSPAHEGPGNYPRTNLRNIYMPPWKDEELHDCMNKVYPHCKDNLLSQIKKWGGSMRSLTTDEDSRNTLLEEFLDDTCLVLYVVNTQEGQSGILERRYQWLVHMIPIEDDNGSTNYGKVTFSFPSHFIASRVAQKICGLKFDWKILELPKLLGNAYESHVLDSLFRVSPTSTVSLRVKANLIPTRKMVSVPAVKDHLIFSSKDVITEPKKGMLYIPSEPNRPGIYFVMPPWIFQVTIAKSHTAKKLNKMLEQFQSTKNWKLCFVLPSAIAEEFSFPKLSYPSIECTYTLKFDFGQ